MNEEKLLILGADGQLGRALRQQYPAAQALNSHQFDITNRTVLERFNWSNVSTILNAAAYTQVDNAQTDQGRIAAWRINAKAVADLARIATNYNLQLVHISTDYVFDGTQKIHREDEPHSPLSVYGASKAAGEIAAAVTPSHFILRTSWVIGEGKNFVRTMLELGKKGVEPTVVDDQVGRPTFTSDLVLAINHLLKNQADYGLYNVTNDGDPISWAGLAREIFHEAGYNQPVVGTTTSKYYARKDNMAPRPLNSTFDLSKIKGTGFVVPDWRGSLKGYIEGGSSGI